MLPAAVATFVKPYCDILYFREYDSLDQFDFGAESVLVRIFASGLVL